MSMTSKNTKRFRSGIILILTAIAIVLISVFGKSKVNVFAGVISILLLLMVISCAKHRLYTGVFFPLAFIYIINYSTWHIHGLTPGVVFLVAFLLSIGMGLLVKPEWKKECKLPNDMKDDGMHCNFGDTVEDDSSRAYCNTYFDGKRFHCTSDNFKELELHCRFSGQLISLVDVVVPSGKCQLIVDISYSGVELHIPANWEVVDETSRQFSGITDKGKNPSGSAVTLTITGNLRFAGLSIVRV